MMKETTKMTDFGREISAGNSKKVENYMSVLHKSRQRLEKVIRQGTKKTDFESYTCCFNAVCSAISFLDKVSKL
ncbi:MULTISPECIES: hypothetical protein [Candidatus Ichthyocystis]|uniref:Uncharacterized protein n=1 Tax=Candidatus Ichthyocystis hellenicum TaxID=1561003 RepID=A0A0S4M2I0_9BURK|nr:MULTISPECIES: hypothetical protein [Ichthyocystis]CUT17090.1 hypothetical protein Ark11_0233 [Candidatus Ichthyocystis hellenicum]